MSSSLNSSRFFVLCLVFLLGQLGAAILIAVGLSPELARNIDLSDMLLGGILAFMLCGFVCINLTSGNTSRRSPGQRRNYTSYVYTAAIH